MLLNRIFTKLILYFIKCVGFLAHGALKHSREKIVEKIIRVNSLKYEKTKVKAKVRDIIEFEILQAVKH